MPRASSACTYGCVTSSPKLRKRRKSRQMCFAATGTGFPPERSVTFQLLSLTIHSTSAPVASGNESSIDHAEMLRVPYGRGTGSATTAGCPFDAERKGASGTYAAWSVTESPVITGANAALMHA